jgi:HD-GYP domain-containing protein (c-di-GMP phosphodiesterase class II)
MAEFSEPAYRAIKIEALLRFGQNAPVEVFLRLSDSKYIKVVHREESKDLVLQKYYDRGIRDVFLQPDEFTIFTMTVRNELLAKIQQEKSTSLETTPSPVAEQEHKVRQLDGAMEVIKAIFATDKVDDDAKIISKAICNETVKLVKRTNIFQHFKLFQKNCSQEYMMSVLTTYVTSMMLDKFNWSNDEIKKKVALAAILCDVRLTREEVDVMYQAKNDRDQLTKKILYHPIETAQMLADESKFFSAETLQIIEQHHEAPNGSGYPKGTDYSRITILTAVYLVANFFVEKMFDKSFNLDEQDWNKEKMSGIMTQIRNKYYNGNFRKASEVLEDLYGTEKLSLSA